jgi:hypothetical protein
MIYGELGKIYNIKGNHFLTVYLYIYAYAQFDNTLKKRAVITEEAKSGTTSFGVGTTQAVHLFPRIVKAMKSQITRR